MDITKLHPKKLLKKAEIGLLPVFFNDTISLIDAQFAGSGEVGDALVDALGMEFGQTSVVPGLGQAFLELDGPRIVVDGPLVVVALGIEGGAVIVE